MPVIFWLLCDLGLFALTNILSTQEGILSKVSYIGISYMLHLIGALMAFSALNAIAERINWKDNVIFQFLQKHSFTIYLFHQQVIYWVVDWLNGEVSPWIIVVISFVTAMAVSSFIAVVLERWKVTRFLVGKKI